ncbi:type VI secretion system baseplate subunit TssK [Cellvibrio sp. KY-GH-1]|uniref:type VI secretion system baseplate subunit TssK n=1 Tax=Cellvibrio sp. KY-GH-1 TaxID=2303332 RepID=UPI0012460AC6|nr:type VI secretion system baseplate subunit TssK [Cellvibrio sp. KY-GH-1]QEY16729.1 type VI secretion system baseplate subunit TssK [Cellvibrio sp. KY-GH-1]
MDAFKKVVWCEGMFLRPQHFQQQERYLEQMRHQRAQAPANYFWGFRNLRIDSAALSQGIIAVTEAEGIFPDGTPFAFSLPQEAPAPLVIGEGVNDQLVYLALPAQQHQSELVAFDPLEQSLARYGVEDFLAEDINSIGGEPAELQIARPRLRLLLQTELTDSWVALGMLRIVERRADRQLAIDPLYIPALISVFASSTLTHLINEVLGLVRQRADVLSTRISQAGRGGISEVGEFLMLQLLNRSEPLIAHLLQGRGLGPETAYLQLIALCGELATFASDSRRCEHLPAYWHDDAEQSFHSLVQLLRRYLSTVLEQNAIEIPLIEKNYGVRIGQVVDRELFNSCQFVLAVRASVPTDTLKQSFPRQIKLGSVDKIRDLVNLQLPGILIQSLPIAPRQIPYHTGSHYFELDTGSEMWKAFVSSGTIAMHIAGDFPDLEIQCWAIRR